MLWHHDKFGAVESSYPRHTVTGVVEGQDINDTGYATGWECVPYGAMGFCATQALRWLPTQATYPFWPTVEALGPLGDQDRAYAINNGGAVVGTTQISLDDRAWIALLGGTMQALPLGTRFSESWAGDINDGNVTVGVARAVSSGAFRFVKWVAGLPAVDLGIAKSSEWPNGRADIRISNAGRIAGNGAGVPPVPFTFKGGVLTDLPYPAGGSARVDGINSCGEIVGTAVSHGEHVLIRWRRLVHGVPACD
jgi:hypothetical protein